MRLRQPALFLCAVLTIFGSAIAQSDPLAHRWPVERAEALVDVAAQISDTGSNADDFPFRELAAALDSDDVAAIDRRANELVAALARGLANGIVPPAARRNWRLESEGISDASVGLAIGAIISGQDPLLVLQEFEPPHPEYRALKIALKSVGTDSARRVIAANLERWRWMPRSLGRDYVIVNTPAFELTVVRNGIAISRRRVIVGARKTPTRQFAASITGVAFNPTWYVPSSIVAESVGALMAEQPHFAEQLGYYIGDDGGVRQKPGPANALGRMKLLMPNPFGVFLHDTPNKALFERKDRALSHGCVRVEDALGLASDILGPDWDRDMLQAIVETNETTSVELAEPIPVYITYFTATVDATGELATHRDIYGLDKAVLKSRAASREDLGGEIGCSAS